MLIIGMLIYILFKNFTETHNFGLIQQKLSKKKDEDKKTQDMNEDTLLDIKNNMIASYVLCGFILLLLLYVIYSLFY